MSQFTASTLPAYEVQRQSGYCLATGRSLEPGEACYSALLDIPAEEREPSDAVGMKRVDVSTDAWNKGYRPPGLFSFWKTTVPDRAAKKKLFVDDAVLLNLLRRLEDTQEPQRLNFRYVVALILMRKKLIRLDRTELVTVTPPHADAEQSEASGNTLEYWHFTPKLDVTKGHFGKWDDANTLRVLDPKLDEDGMRQVTEQLGEILEAEL